jgi:DNA polymerase III epsilon subunit-like protein
VISFIDKHLVVFDVEVSDVDESRSLGTIPEIIDIGAVKVSSDLTVIERFSSLVRPDNLDLVTEQTTRLTGITPAMLKDAPHWSKVWPEFCKLTQYNNSRLAAFHALNDYGWLRAAYAKNRLGFPHSGFVFDIASWLYGFCSWYGIRPRSFGLKACCARLEVPFTESHRGLADAEAALGLLTAIQRIEHEHGSLGDT